jgi:hypothetical protein
MEEDRMTNHSLRHSQLAPGFSLPGGRGEGVSAGAALVRQGLMGGALVASCLLTWDSAAAEPPSDTEKIERLERQSELLQKQLDRQNELIRGLQQEIAQARKKPEKKETDLAKRSEPSVNSNEKETQQAKRADPPVNSTQTSAEPSVHSSGEPSVRSKVEWRPPPTEAEIIRGTQPAVVATLPQFGGVKFSFWGWLEAAGVFREHNTVNDTLTVFNAIPYPYSPLYKENEFHGTARQSQISVLAEGNIDDAQKLSGYLEMDFLAIGTESNYLDYQRLAGPPAARL